MSARWIFVASTSQWTSLGGMHREMRAAGLEVRVDDLPRRLPRTTLVRIIEANGEPLTSREFTEHEIFGCEQWCSQQLNDYRSWK